MVAHEQYSRRPALRQDPGAGTATASSHEPERRPTAAQQRAQWGHIEVPLCLRDWHTEANQQYAVETANKRRRTDGGSYRSNGHGTAPSQSQAGSTGELGDGRPAHAPVVAPAEAPRATLFEIVNCSETAGQLCSTRGCYRPRRHYRINLDYFTSGAVSFATLPSSDDWVRAARAEAALRGGKRQRRTPPHKGRGLPADSPDGPQWHRRGRPGSDLPPARCSIKGVEGGCLWEAGDDSARSHLWYALRGAQGPQGASQQQRRSQTAASPLGAPLQ